MGYEVEITEAAERDLKRIPKQFQQQIKSAILDLESEPRPQGCKKLRGLDGIYRVRSGDFRICYGVDDGTVKVTVVGAGDRKNIYSTLKRRLA